MRIKHLLEKSEPAHMLNNTEPGNIRRAYMVLLGLICLCIVANCFFKLSGGQLKDWDEARHGLSAYEMLQHGNFLMNTYGGAPDYWNAKPPLSFWGVALGYSLFGVNPLGLRFFSALCACFMFFLTLTFCCKKISARAAVFSGLIFLSLNAFFLRHHARTADPDALFLLFNTAGLLAVLAWPKRYAAYYVASLLTGLAFLTKSFHVIPMALLVSGFFLMDFSLSRQSMKQAALCLLAALAPVALWALARFQLDGTLFFERMVFYDLLNRATETIEGHRGGPFYYLEFVALSYKFWVLVVAMAGTFWVLRTRAQRKTPSMAVPLYFDAKTILKLALAATLPLLLYSLSASKLFWYSYPVFPFISILLGLFLDREYTLMETKNKRLAKVFMFCIFGTGLIGEAYTLKRIHGDCAQQNPVHVAMSHLGEISENHHALLFLDKGEWRPADFLAAKLYGDFQLTEGGAPAYESTENVSTSFLLSRTEKTHNGHN
ncbi:MAG: glycosyltransferase family 39 protein [Cystobacterineae bacterium]|nr:glycosyltransferase family 39 protein [Cystobacterineae bacterium]